MTHEFANQAFAALDNKHREILRDMWAEVAPPTLPFSTFIASFLQVSINEGHIVAELPACTAMLHKLAETYQTHPDRVQAAGTAARQYADRYSTLLNMMRDGIGKMIDDAATDPATVHKSRVDFTPGLDASILMAPLTSTAEKLLFWPFVQLMMENSKIRQFLGRDAEATFKLRFIAKAKDISAANLREGEVLAADELYAQLADDAWIAVEHLSNMGGMFAGTHYLVAMPDSPSGMGYHLTSAADKLRATFEQGKNRDSN